MESKHSLLKSFKFAFDGFDVAVKKGRNFRIQLILGIMALIFAAILNFSPAEYVGLILIISIVLILELINTAIESIVNMVSPEVRDEAKIAKDVSAGAVLIAAFVSLFIGAYLFLPKLLALLK